MHQFFVHKIITESQSLLGCVICVKSCFFTLTMRKILKKLTKMRVLPSVKRAQVPKTEWKVAAKALRGPQMSR